MPDEALPPGPREYRDGDLERELAALGPLMARRERLAAEEPDPAFVARLRARLIAGETAPVDLLLAPPTAGLVDMPDPAFTHRLRARLLAPAPAGRRRQVMWAGLAAAVLLLAVIAIPRLPRGGRAPTVADLPRRSGPVMAWTAPQPVLADLVRGYPAPFGAGGGGPGYAYLPPQQSPLDPLPGVPFAGHLTLTTGTLPVLPARLAVFRLGSPITDTAQLAVQARRLGIRAPVTTAAAANAVWLSAADGVLASPVPPQPIHSLAISEVTGELIYHDARPLTVAQQRTALSARQAVALARTWVAKLGWPGARMPLQAATPGIAYGAPYAARSWTVTLGWIGSDPATTPAATLWLAPDGHVLEACLWPPATASAVVPAHSLAAAWSEVRGGLAPFALGGPVALNGSGQGTVQSVRLSYVLAADSNGTLYLAPVYRFAGTASFAPGSGSPTSRLTRTSWFALVAAAQP